MVISHNLAAMNTQRQYKINIDNKRKTTEQLSSGYRINRAADDAAGLSISEKLRYQIRGLDKASNNIQDGISLAQTADGALNEVHSILQRMNELTIQGANDTNTDSDREAIQSELDQLKKEINRIGADSEFNHVKLFSTAEKPVTSSDPKMTDIKVWNSDINTYGGIVFNNDRYTWNDISPNLINADGSFNPGTYPIKVKNGATITFFAEEGDTAPNIRRKYDMQADNDGISIDGEKFLWGQIKDANGDAFNPSDIKAGDYNFTYKGQNIQFSIPENADMEMVRNRINQGDIPSYSWVSDTLSTIADKAVTIKPYNQIPVNSPVTASSANINKVAGKYTLLADNDGVTVKADPDDGRTYDKMTWAQLGINSWDSGKTIDTNTFYTYTDSSSGLNLSFKIPYEESSKDGIINGLNNVSVTGSKITGSGTRIESAYFSIDDLKAMIGWNPDNPSSNMGVYVDRHPHILGGYTYTANVNGVPFNVTSTSPMRLSSTNGSYVNLGNVTFVSDTIQRTVTTSQPYTIDYSASENSITSGNVANVTEFQSLTTALDRKLNIQSTSVGHQGIDFLLKGMDTSTLGLNSLNVVDPTRRDRSISEIGNAIERLSEIRSMYGAEQNRLEAAYNIDRNVSENTSSAESRIRDTDIAEAMVKLSTENILAQFGEAMITQANQSSSQVLNLLQ